MSVRVRGSNPRNFTAATILQRAIDRRLKDNKYGIPLQIIYLDWNSSKKNFHQSKTKGNFDDLFIERTGAGLVVSYRTPGSLEWLKDGLTGEFQAMCPLTPNNLGMLASCYYDNLWTIRDRQIENQVKEMADKIDEENKKIHHRFIVIKRELDKATGIYVNVEKVTDGTLYDYHVYRRGMQHQGPSDSTMTPPLINDTAIQSERERIEQQKRDLAERERILEEREKKSGISVVVDSKKVEDTTIEYTEEYLDGLNIGKLRKIARDKFGITDSFKKTKDQLMPVILGKQMGEANDNDDLGTVEQIELPMAPPELPVETEKPVEESVVN